MRQRFLPSLILASISFVTPVASSERASLPKVTLRARSLQPGEVVGITVESPRPLRSVEAQVFGRSFPCYFEKPVWRGLIGIDLDVQAGLYTVRIRAEDSAGAPVFVEHPLSVRSKVFPTRRLTVDEKFVNPPPEELARISQESKKVEEIFATVTRRRLWKGPFGKPVPGTPSSSFGKRSILNNQPRSPHSGADFDVETGTPVKSPNSGRVVLAADLYFSGNTVIVDHGQGLYSYFGHLSKFIVKEGMEVRRGDLLGYVGATGRVTGPHLHWAIRLVSTRVDPTSLLAAAQE